MSTVYRAKTRPYKHQREAIKKLLYNGYGGALLMEPRTGKTKTAIDWVGILRSIDVKDPSIAIVFAPATVLPVWEQELKTHCSVPFDCILWGAKKRREKEIPKPADKLLWVLVNYEALSANGVRTPGGHESTKSGRGWVKKTLNKLAETHTAAVILDESHRIKSCSSKAAQALYTIGAKAAYRLIMTGTPLTKASRVEDIYSQWKFLNPRRFMDVPTKSDFMDRYSIRNYSRFGFVSYTGVRNRGELAERMMQDSYIVKREECYDLPERTIENIPVDLTGTSRDRYLEIEGCGISGDVSATHLLSRLTELSKITGGHIGPEWTKLGSAKIQVLLDIIRQHKEEDTPLVVVARFRAEIMRIRDLCYDEDIPCNTIMGGSDISGELSEWRNYCGCRVMIIQPQAGALGIDLREADHMVWYSLTYSWTDYSQACDRIALCERPTTITHLLAQDTVDWEIARVLQEDGDVAEAVMSGDIHVGA
jgi:hypothetical protein